MTTGYQSGYLNFGNARTPAGPSNNNGGYYGYPVTYNDGGYGGNGNMVDGKRHKQEITKFFGIPGGSVNTTSSGDTLPREDQALPDGYAGPNLHMREVVIGIIKEQEVWPIAEMFPLEQNEGSIEFAITHFEFHNHLLGRTPEEVASRHVTRSMSSQVATTQRYGIAFMIEHGFYDTPWGAQVYRGQLQQMANAVIWTVCLMAMTELLEADPLSTNMWQRGGNRPSARQYDSLVKREIEDMGFLNKQSFGLSKKIEEMQRALRQHSQQAGNMLIIPAPAVEFVKHRPELGWFLFSGQKSTPESKILVQSADKLVIRTSVAYPQGHGLEDLDVMMRDHWIGSHTFMIEANLDNMPGSKRTVGSDDIFMFNYNQDQFEKVAFADALKKSGLVLDDDYTLNPDFGPKFFAMFGGSNVKSYLEKTKQLTAAVERINAFNPREQQAFMELVAGKDVAGVPDAIDSGVPGARAEYVQENTGRLAAAGARTYGRGYARREEERPAAAGRAYGSRDDEKKVNTLRPTEFLVGQFVRLKNILREAAPDGAADTRGVRAVGAAAMIIQAVTDIDIDGLRPGAEGLINGFLDTEYHFHDLDGDIQLRRPIRRRADGDDAFDEIIYNGRRTEEIGNWETAIETLSAGLEALRTTDPLSFLPTEGRFGLRDSDDEESKHDGVSGRSFRYATSFSDNLSVCGSNWLDNVEHHSTLTEQGKRAVSDAIKLAIDRISATVSGLSGQDELVGYKRAAQKVSSSATSAINLVLGALANKAPNAGESFPGDEDEADTKVKIVTGLSPNLGASNTAVVQSSHEVSLKHLYDLLPSSSLLLLAVHSSGRMPSSLERSDRVAATLIKAASNEAVRRHEGFQASLLLSAVLYYATNICALRETRNTDVKGLKIASESLSEHLGSPNLNPAQLHLAAHIERLRDLATSVAHDGVADLTVAVGNWRARQRHSSEWGYSSSASTYVTMPRQGLDSFSDEGELTFVQGSASSAALKSYADNFEAQFRNDGPVMNAFDVIIRWLLNSGKPGSSDKWATTGMANDLLSIMSQGSSLSASVAQRRLMAQLVAVLVQRYSMDSGNRDEAARRVIQTASAMTNEEMLRSASVSAEMSTVAGLLKEVVEGFETSVQRRRGEKHSTIAVPYTRPDEVGYKRNKRGAGGYNKTPAVAAEEFQQEYRRIRGKAAAAADYKFEEDRVAYYLSILDYSQFGVLKFFVEHGIPTGIGFILARPHICIRAGDIALLRAGSGTGRTIWQRANFQLGDDINLKIHYGHFTIYAGCFVHAKKNIIIKRAAYIDNYVSGGGLDFFDAVDPADVEMYQSDKQMDKDMFALAVPYNWKPKGIDINIVGRNHPDFSDDMSELCYPTAELYAAHWGWQHNDQVSPFRKHYKLDERRIDQTITIQDGFMAYDWTTGTYTKVMPNKGHVGDLYVGKVRDIRQGNVWKTINPAGTNGVTLQMP